MTEVMMTQQCVASGGRAPWASPPCAPVTPAVVDPLASAVSTLVQAVVSSDAFCSADCVTALKLILIAGASSAGTYVASLPLMNSTAANTVDCFCGSMAKEMPEVVKLMGEYVKVALPGSSKSAAALADASFNLLTLALSPASSTCSPKCSAAYAGIWALVTTQK
eukprot:2467882-Prymnesium_polylepis.1